MRVMVTGGAGFVGSHIVDRLLAKGDDVLVVDDLSTGSASNLPPGVDLEEMDIASPKLLDVASAWRPEALTHAAAQPSVPVSMSDPLLDAHTNVIGGLNVLRAAVEAGASQVVYINTGGALYGEPNYLPCDENHPKKPLSPYGLSKLTMERYFRLMLPPSVTLKVLRLANVYGPRQSSEGESGVISIFIRRMQRGEPLTIDGDGQQTRDFVYVGGRGRRPRARPRPPGAADRKHRLGDRRLRERDIRRHLQADRLRTPSPARAAAPWRRQARRARRDPRSRTPRLDGHDRPRGRPSADRRRDAATLTWLLATAPRVAPPA